MKKKYSKQTKLIQSDFNRSNFNETSEALFLTSGFIYRSAEEAEECFLEKKKKFMYSRFSNPTIETFEKKMAVLEGAESCLATSTGMAAVFSIFMSQLKSGDRLVSSKALFGSCHYIITKILPNFGINVVMVDGQDTDQWKEALKVKTKLVFFETPSNPCLDLVDIKSVSMMAHKVGAKVIVDNVFATPINQKPLELGADIIMYSATKHIDGQGRVLGGAILGEQKLCEEIIKPFIRNTGPSISPFNAWLLSKSLDTLELRVNQQNTNTKKIVSFLQAQNSIENLIYPWSENFSQLRLAKKQMNSGGSIISFRLKKKNNLSEKKTAFNFINKLKIIKISNNLGDCKSLVTHPYTTTHQKLEKNEKRSLRITQNLIRLSVGLESFKDLIDDIRQAL
ncbi:O-succinylhomoserine sulfhydrylase [Alphaproteobacteria bacterium]|nr:O-succinylhomoserine sulfhydrylase [Alphaproteobacteria bacterium]